MLLLICLLGLRIGEAANPGPGNTLHPFDDPDGSVEEDDWDYLCQSWHDDIPPLMHEECASDHGNEAAVGPQHAAAISLSTFSDEVMADWLSVESNFRLRAPKEPRERDQSVPHPVRAGDDRAFVPAKRFVGASDGYIFTLGENGLGYYRDSMVHTPSQIVRIALAEAIPDIPSLGSVPDRFFARRSRAWRARDANGRRRRRGTSRRPRWRNVGGERGGDNVVEVAG